MIRRRHHRGFALASAVFILVTLAILGVFAVNVSTGEHIGSALDIQGVRVNQAARAGLEWGMYQVQSSAAYNFSYGPAVAGINTANPNSRTCPTSPSTFSPSAPSLSAYTVTVTCVAADDPANGGPTVYRITAIACNQPVGGICPGTPGGTYVERKLEASL
jgi:MSHA biogenesis protein MshP